MLAQCVLDGYNVCLTWPRRVPSLTYFQVCIFAYGQTGSGKSWTMEGGQVCGISIRTLEVSLTRQQNEDDVGMIPRAIDMIFTVSGQLKDRGWKYQMEGQFLEVYNEVVSQIAFPVAGLYKLSGKSFTLTVLADQRSSR